MEQLARGFSGVLGAVPFMLARPKILKLVLAPFLLAIVIATLLLWWLSSNIDPLVGSAISSLPNFVASAAGGTLRVLLWVALLGLGYVAFLAFVSVLTTPFCEMISEAVEEELTGARAPAFSAKILVRDLLLGVAHSLRRLAILVTSLLGLFLLSALIPVIGALLAIGLGAYFSGRFSAYDCYDTIWARKGTSYSAKRAYLREHRAHATGLGLAVAGAALIPIINALAFPLGTIAATQTYIKDA